MEEERVMKMDQQPFWCYVCNNWIVGWEKWQDHKFYCTSKLGENMGFGKTKKEKVKEALGWVEEELVDAMGKFPPFHTAHEGYAVLLEEVDELWEEVKKGRKGTAREEAKQVAAMAVRLMVDVL